jgi:putative tryptophan/tyrosine transport system substrate-binding protein
LAASAVGAGAGAQRAGRLPARRGAASGQHTRDVIEPFVQGLREAGFVEGRNLVIDTRWAEGKPERLPALVAELLAARPDVIVTAGNPPAQAAKAATSTVPIVAAAVDSPVDLGLVPSMARPGGNMTGISASAASWWRGGCSC